MKTKSEKAAISNKFSDAAKRAKERGFLCAEIQEGGKSCLHVFDKGLCVLVTAMDKDGLAFSRFYDSKGVCIRTVTASPVGAVALIGRVY